MPKASCESDDSAVPVVMNEFEKYSFFMYVKGVSNFLNIYTVILILFYRVLSIAAFVTEVMTPLRPPAGGRLQPISLDSAWKTPTQDDAVNEGNLKNAVDFVIQINSLFQMFELLLSSEY